MLQDRPAAYPAMARQGSQEDLLGPDGTSRDEPGEAWGVPRLAATSRFPSAAPSHP